MTTRGNDEILADFIDVFDAGNEAATLALVEEVFAKDHVAHFASRDVRGREAYKECVRNAYATFADMRHAIVEHIAEGDRLATRVRFTATCRAEFVGLPAAGQSLDVPIIYVHRFVDGKIAEAWLDWDSLFLVSQQLRAAAQQPEPAESELATR